MANTVAILMHVPHEPPGLIAEALVEAGLEPACVRLFESVPARLELDRAAALVVMGGPMNVDQTDRYPFLAREVEWICEAIDRGLPTLGVCLGSQLIAKALGARVSKNPTKEIGWFPVNLLPPAADDRLFRDLPARPTVFQWHGDTFTLPEGAVLLAGSERCPRQAFRFADHVYALQFHLEVSGEIIESWLTHPDNVAEMAELDDVDPDAIRRRMREELPPMLRLGRVVFDRFAGLAVG